MVQYFRRFLNKFVVFNKFLNKFPLNKYSNILKLISKYIDGILIDSELIAT